MKKIGSKTTIERCFWCGRLKNVGIEETEENIRESVIADYTPCERCKKVFDAFVQVVGVVKEPLFEGMPSIGKEGDEMLYPTGFRFDAPEDFLRVLVKDAPDEKLLDDVLKDRVLLMPDHIVREFYEIERGVLEESEIEDQPAGEELTMEEIAQLFESAGFDPEEIPHTEDVHFERTEKKRVRRRHIHPEDHTDGDTGKC